MNKPEFLKWESVLSKEEIHLIDSIYDDMSLDIQIAKMDKHRVQQDARDKIIKQLKVRPKILASIAKLSGVNSVVEVGTAQGMQSVVFSELFGCKVYTCDIVDVRDKRAKSDLISFTLGNSVSMSREIQIPFDLAWIDGAHDHYSVVSDFAALRKKANANTIWVFDDFDHRFGCFYDISSIAATANESYVIDLGLTGSGQTNRIMVCKGL